MFKSKCPKCKTDLPLILSAPEEHVYDCSGCSARLQLKVQKLAKLAKKNHLAWAIIAAPVGSVAVYHFGLMNGRWDAAIGLFLGYLALSVAFSFWLVVTKAEFDVL